MNTEEVMALAIDHQLPIATDSVVEFPMLLVPRGMYEEIKDISEGPCGCYKCKVKRAYALAQKSIDRSAHSHLKSGGDADDEEARESAVDRATDIFRAALDNKI